MSDEETGYTDIELEFSEEEWLSLHNACRQTGQTVSEFINESLRRYVELHEIEDDH